MKNIIKSLLVLLAISPVAALAQDQFELHGKLPALSQKKIYLEYPDNGKTKKDSVWIDKGKFVFKGKVQYPTTATLYIASDSKSNQDFLPFYLENGKINVVGKDSLKNAVVTGSQSNEDNLKLRALQRPYQKSADSLVAVYYKLSPEERKDSAFIKSASQIMKRTEEGYNRVTREFINSNLNSFIALTAFRDVELAHNFNPDTAASRFAKFSDSLRSSTFGQKLYAIIDIGNKTNVGAVAMDFQLADSLNNMVKLSDFRGKYVLLDFWASWCVPCRAENPVMLAAYNKFQSKNFTILGVSLDDEKSRRAWVNAVKIDGIPWTQVSDLKGFASPVAKNYGVSAIPTNFLIDPQGKIIARNLRGHDLDAFLSKIFGE